MVPSGNPSVIVASKMAALPMYIGLLKNRHLDVII